MMKVKRPAWMTKERIAIAVKKRAATRKRNQQLKETGHASSSEAPTPKNKRTRRGHPEGGEVRLDPGVIIIAELYGRVTTHIEYYSRRTGIPVPVLAERLGEVLRREKGR